MKEDAKASDLQEVIRQKAFCIDVKIIRFAKIPKKAFGLITFDSLEESEKVIKIFHNSVYDGNIISISKVSFFDFFVFFI